TQGELAAANERHVAATSTQTQHQKMASTNKEFRHSVNGGHPSVAATSNAGNFKGAGVMAARHDGGAAGALNAGHGPAGANTLKPANAALGTGQKPANTTLGTGAKPANTTLGTGANTLKPANNTLSARPNASLSTGPGANNPSGGLNQTPKNFGGG